MARKAYKENDVTHVFHAERHVALSTLLAVPVLSGCGSTSGLDSEVKPVDDSPNAEELSNDLDAFIEQRHTPAVRGRTADVGQVEY